MFSEPELVFLTILSIAFYGISVGFYLRIAAQEKMLSPLFDFAMAASGALVEGKINRVFFAYQLSILCLLAGLSATLLLGDLLLYKAFEVFALALFCLTTGYLWRLYERHRRSIESRPR